jgi:hypothetical protein
MPELGQSGFYEFCLERVFLTFSAITDKQIVEKIRICILPPKFKWLSA